ncbi:MAG: CARDB domain-containing protein, partial [Thermoplasmata archaeon]
MAIVAQDATAAQAKPDLIVYDITWSPSNPTPGDYATITVTIKNVGTKDIRNKLFSNQVEYYLPGVGGYSWLESFSNLKVDSYVSFHVTSWALSEGTYTLRAWADERGWIDESDEGNNERIESMPVYGHENTPPVSVINDITPGRVSEGGYVDFM